MKTNQVVFGLRFSNRVVGAKKNLTDLEPSFMFVLKNSSITFFYQNSSITLMHSPYTVPCLIMYIYLCISITKSFVCVTQINARSFPIRTIIFVSMCRWKQWPCQEEIKEQSWWSTYIYTQAWITSGDERLYTTGLASFSA